MAWVRIDTGFARHPKLLQLTPAERWVHLAAMCWAAENATDGRLPRPALGVISPSGKRPVARLVEVGLWEQDGDGWRIHDWTDYNLSAEDAKRQLQAKRDRQRQWAEKRRSERRRRVDASTDKSNDASTDASKDAPPRARKTRPDPTPSSNEEGRVGGLVATPEPEPVAQTPPPNEPGPNASAHEWRQWNAARHDTTTHRPTLAELARADENLPEFLKVALQRQGTLNANGNGRPGLTVIPGGDGGAT